MKIEKIRGEIIIQGRKEEYGMRSNEIK